jgi:hypothetical protein
MEKTSLEKSHSKWSNFKLTILCLSITISVSAIWTVLTFIKIIEINIILLVLLISLIILITNIFFLTKFKR